MNSTLTITSPHGMTSLPAGRTYVIGRSPDSAVHLTDGTVSKIHAEVHHEAGGWMVTDRGSFNGTHVNGARITGPHPLRNGDTLTCGNAHLRIGITPEVPVPAAGPYPSAPPAPYHSAPPAPYHSAPPPPYPSAPPPPYPSAPPPPYPPGAPPNPVPAPPGPPPPHNPDPSRPGGTGGGTANGQPSSMVLGGLSMHEPTTIGRAPDNTIVLADSAVSRHHARITPSGSGHVVTDLGSHNGTYVNGALVATAPLRPGDRITVGNTTLVLGQDSAQLSRIQRRAVLRADQVTLLAEDGSHRLAPTSLEFSPGEMIAIIGPAGAGKSTLLNVLAGITRPTSGRVTVDDQPLEASFANLAYVPQDDLIHRDLTPREALTYAAGLRLPPDHHREDLNQVVNSLIATLNLTDCADRTIHNVSGGQRKRSSVGMELVGDPRILFLDEPAAGLDAAHDRDLMLVLRRLADSGRAVILTTHNTWHLGMCDRLLLVGRGGSLRFAGSPSDMMGHFGVTDIAEVYDRLKGPDPAQGAPGGRQAAGPPAMAHNRPPNRVHATHIRYLTARNFRVLTRDVKSLATALVAAPVMALLAALLFGDNALTTARASSADSLYLLLALTLVATWLGAFGSLRAIVTERRAWRRELTLGVAAASYLTAKLITHSVLVLVQVALILGVTFLIVSTTLSTTALLAMSVIITVTALTGMTAGLAISAFSRTEARAVTLVLPFVVMQFFFAGAIVAEMEMGPLRVISWITSARWSVAGLGSVANLNETPQSLNLPPPDGSPELPSVFLEKYGTGFFETPAGLCLVVLMAIGAGLILLTHHWLRRADRAT